MWSKSNLNPLAVFKVPTTKGREGEGREQYGNGEGKWKVV